MKKLSYFQLFSWMTTKRKEVFILAILFVFLIASISPAQELIERYRLGNNIEALTYISTGNFAGRFAFADGWYVYFFDIYTGTYEKLFSYANLDFGGSARGICYISTGDFAGNFLLNDPAKSTTLFIISPSGALVSEVKAVDFEWTRHCEGITEIISGPYQGKFAMIGFKYPSYTPHIFIFKIENVSGTVSAFLEKDIVNINLGPFPLGICFLSDDYPDPLYKNHFVVSDLNTHLLTVFDIMGNKKASFPVDYAEGLAYISSGPYQGKLMVSDYEAKDTWLRNLDGSVKTHYSVVVGLGISFPLTVTWLSTSNQFLIFRWAGIYWSHPFFLVSRSYPGIWEKDKELIYSGIRSVRSITDLTPDGNYYLLGWNVVSGKNLYEVQSLDSDFKLKLKYPLPSEYIGQYFTHINYVPGVTPSDDKFSLTSKDKIYLFNNTFSYPATIIDLSGKVYNVYSSYYDATIKRYYLLDKGTLIKIFDPSWNLITEFDVSNLTSRIFRISTKITSGDLRNNIALLNMGDSELVIVNFEYQIAIYQLKKLINEIQKSNIDQGITNSLIKKLENAISSLEKKDISAAINKIQAFQNEVQAQSGKKIPSDLAERWIDISKDIIKSLEYL